MIKKLLIIPVLLLLSGCAASGIKISGKGENPARHTMFGSIPSRNFYSHVPMSDSLVLKWEAETNGSFPQSSITVFGDNIFVNDLSGRVYCFNSITGKTIGQLKHKGPVYTTPVINKYNVIYVESLTDEDKSILRVYNFLEGKVVSEEEIKGRVKTEIIGFEDAVFFITEKGLLYKFSHIGDQYWMKDTESEIHSGPVSDGVFIYIINDEGELLKINLEDGNIFARIKTGLDVTSGLTINKENLLFGSKDGYLYSMNKDSGKINWKYNTGSKIIAVPVFSDKNIYTVNLSGYIVSLNAESGKEIWKKNSGGVFNSTPLLTENYLIVPDLSNRVLLIDTNNGSEVKILELPNRAKLSPVIVNNLLIIGFDRGVVRAYEII